MPITQDRLISLIVIADSYSRKWRQSIELLKTHKKEMIRGEVPIDPETIIDTAIHIVENLCRPSPEMLERLGAEKQHFTSARVARNVTAKMLMRNLRDEAKQLDGHYIPTETVDIDLGNTGLQRNIYPDYKKPIPIKPDETYLPIFDINTIHQQIYDQGKDEPFIHGAMICEAIGEIIKSIDINDQRPYFDQLITDGRIARTTNPDEPNDEFYFIIDDPKEHITYSGPQEAKES